jgi:hypothetical protein
MFNRHETGCFMDDMRVTVGLRQYAVRERTDGGDDIECDCDEGTIMCPPEATFTELRGAVRALADYEMPPVRRLPLQDVS